MRSPFSVTRRHIQFLFGGTAEAVMRTGQIGLVPADKGWASGVVAWATQSSWTHVVVAVSETEVVSAEPGGTRYRPINYYPGTVWSKYPLRPSQRRRIARYARTRIGTPYAWWDYFAVGVALVFRARTPDWLASHVADTHTLLCSQLADLALQAGGVHVFFDERPAGAVTPASFAKVFIARGWADKP